MLTQQIVFKVEGQQVPEEVKDVGFKLMKNGEEYSTIRVQGGQWNQEEFIDFLSHIEQWNQKKFFFRKNSQQLLLKQIVNIKFNQLTLLALQDNQITSLEVFSHIWLPNLNSIGIQRNKVRTLAMMRKASCPYLRDFGIAGNNIIDCQQMIFFFSTQLCMLGIQTSGLRQQSQSINWLGKLETDRLSHVYLRSNRRIRNYSERLISKLYYRHKNIDARLHNAEEQRGLNLTI